MNRLIIAVDDDAFHRPTLKWMERLTNYGDVGWIADRIRARYPGREADGIYAALGIIRYTRDETIAGVLRQWIHRVAGDAEVLQTPDVLLRMRFGDCDDEAVLGAALAKCLGLPYEFILHRDLDKPAFHHVYLRVQDARGWVPVDRVYGHGAGAAPPGIGVLFRPLRGDVKMRSFVLLSPLPTTSREPVVLTGLGQEVTTAEMAERAATPAKTSVSDWFKTNPIGQALTSGAATLVSVFTGGYAARVAGTAPSALAVAPAAAPAEKAFPTGLVVGGLGIGAAVLLWKRMSAR